MLSDEELVCRLAAGEAHALDALMQRYEQPLARFLHRRTGGRDVDDLYQETWLRIVRASDRFTPQRRFSTWMFQIAVNLCRDWWRRQGAPADLRPSEVESQASPNLDATIDVHSMLARLPDEQREVVALRYLEDMSVREAAAILGCPEGTVKSRLHSALATLSRLAAAPDGHTEDADER